MSPPLTPEQAAQLNSAFLADIAENVISAGKSAPIVPYMSFSPADGAAFFEEHVPPQVGLVQAVFPNFGQCLRHTLQTLLALGFGAACVLNSDSPTLPTEILIDAAKVLARPGRRIVLGPCADGGYYLLGLKSLEPRLFEDISWSTATVLQQTLARAAELGVEVAMLPPWYDVDDAASLRVLMRETVRGIPTSCSFPSYSAKRTRAFLLGKGVKSGLKRWNATSSGQSPAPADGA